MFEDICINWEKSISTKSLGMVCQYGMVSQDFRTMPSFLALNPPNKSELLTVSVLRRCVWFKSWFLVLIAKIKSIVVSFIPEQKLHKTHSKLKKIVVLVLSSDSDFIRFVLKRLIYTFFLTLCSSDRPYQKPSQIPLKNIKYWLLPQDFFEIITRIFKATFQQRVFSFSVGMRMVSKEHCFFANSSRIVSKKISWITRWTVLLFLRHSSIWKYENQKNWRFYDSTVGFIDFMVANIEQLLN